MANLFTKVTNSISNFFTPQEIVHANPKFKKFVELDSNEETVESIIDKAFEAEGQGANGAQYETANAYKNMMYNSMPYEKAKRLRFYRQMAMYPYIGEAMDEICDSCLTEDDNYNVVNLDIQDININDEKKTELTNEFNKFISFFDFENNGYDYIYSFLRDGELVFENLTSKENPQKGIAGVRWLPPECYEYLINDSYELAGIVINAKMVRDPSEQSTAVTKRITANKNWHNVSIRNNYIPTDNEIEIIPMPLKQITLINTGMYAAGNRWSIPVLEKARQPYKQLTLLEDSTIIYRLVRTPERYVFNVDTGKLNPSKAEELVYKLSQKYKNKKGYDPTNATPINGYDPHQMRESWWFPKPEGSKGTEVTSLGGGGTFSELEDLKYFLNKLLVALKIPVERFNLEGSSDKPSGDSITADEFRFAKFIMRILNRFSKGLQESFKTHLQLTGIWKKFKLNDRSFKIKFVPPINYELYYKQQLLNLKMENYETATRDEDFSKEIAMKKYLGWTDEDIKRNYEYREKEILRTAYVERKVDNISDHGDPNELPNDGDDY